jgi:hypothetical protein
MLRWSAPLALLGALLVGAAPAGATVDPLPAPPSHASPAIAASPAPGGPWTIAYADESGALATRSSTGAAGAVPGARVRPDTGPAIAALGDGFVIAFQNDAHRLALASGGAVTDLGLGMGPGSGPSIAVAADGRWTIALRADNGELWTRASDGAAAPVPGAVVAPMTSPSVVALPGGAVLIAFQTAARTLAVVTPAGIVVGLGIGMAPLSSPSVGVDARGAWMIAFQDLNGVLRTRSAGGAGGPVPGAYRLRPDTSPAISVMPGGEAEIAYQTAGGALGLITAQGVVGSYADLRVTGGASPAIAAEGGAGFRAVYRDAGDGRPWTVTPGGAGRPAGLT